MTILSAAGRDVLSAIADYPFWNTIAIQDIRQRYRRSTIGPFWLTITTAVQIATMGVLVGYLLQHDFGKL